jgi:hypothetical protein
VLAVGFLVASPAVAQPREAVKQAGAAYDDGVKLFEQARYAEAARAFLRADELAASSEALSSAIAAARRGGEHLLVARAAERAIAREGQDPKRAAQARQALAEAAPHLSRLAASCEPAPCELELDDEPMQAGERYLLPGTHRLEARGATGANAEERLQLAAGATYRVVLYPTGAGQPVRAAAVSEDAEASEPTAESAAPPSPQAPVAERDEGERPSERPISPGVFYAGVAVSLALVGLTTWSGFDALAAKDELPARPTQDQNDAVTARVRRTDLLLLGTVVMTGLTTYAGVMLVDFGGAKSGVAVVPADGGLFASATGRF